MTGALHGIRLAVVRRRTGIIVACLLEAEAIPWYAFARYGLGLRKTWSL